MRLTERFHSLRALLSKQDFRRLCTSQVFGGLGEWLATLALIGLVWDRTHSAVASGMVLAFRILPAAVLSSVLGLIVDRFDRRRVLVACTAGRAAIYGTLPLVGGVTPILALALVAEIATLAYVAARDATLPRLVPKDQLPAANAVSMASGFAAMPLGSGIFAALGWLGGRVGHSGISLALVAAGGLLAIATLMLGRMAAAGAPPRLRARKTDDGPVLERGALRAVLREDPILRRVVVGAVIIACCGGALLTLGLAYVRETLHAGQAAYSILLTMFCFGALAGIAAVHRYRAQLPKLFHAGGGVMGAILFVMALFPSTAVACAMGFVFGGAFVATFLGGITILQDRVDDTVRGRAFAIAHSGLRVLAVAVGLAAAWGAKRLGAGQVFWSMDGTQVMLAAAGVGLLLSASLVVGRPRVTAIAVEDDDDEDEPVRPSLRLVTAPER